MYIDYQNFNILKKAIINFCFKGKKEIEHNTFYKTAKEQCGILFGITRRGNMIKSCDISFLHKSL